MIINLRLTAGCCESKRRELTRILTLIFFHFRYNPLSKNRQDRGVLVFLTPFSAHFCKLFRQETVEVTPGQFPDDLLLETIVLQDF